MTKSNNKKIILVIKSNTIVEYQLDSLQNKVQEIISAIYTQVNKNKNLQVLVLMHKSRTTKTFYKYLLLLQLTPFKKFNRHKTNQIYNCKIKNQQPFKDQCLMLNLNYLHIVYITRSMMMNHLKIVKRLQKLEMKPYLKMR